ncbi:MAG: YlmC/YmxH family sporulation protein, partial [Clostridiales bacterium]|nr:YlmC/YmxH family sporulation protein [Clostridiales bacterium]
MELTFKDLKSREVINLTDGRSLGHITNLSINFPSGKLAGIIVPERKKGCIAGLFDKSELFIDVKRILKIGNDVILVDLKCGDTCGDSVSLKTPPPRSDNK